MVKCEVRNIQGALSLAVKHTLVAGVSPIKDSRISGVRFMRSLRNPSNSHVAFPHGFAFGKLTMSEKK